MRSIKPGQLGLRITPLIFERKIGMAGQKPDSLMIDNTRYVREDLLERKAIDTAGLPVVIVRSPAAGVFIGSLASHQERVVKLLKCRRLWYWDGAFTLSQMAVDGVSKPKTCKFSCIVDEHLILDACEILYVSQKASDCIYAVKATEA